MEIANRAMDSKQRIERARETQAALERVRAQPSPANTAALHRLHAQHLREDGDLAAAAEAEARAAHAESTSGEQGG
jgi:hypothetical protein